MSGLPEVQRALALHVRALRCDRGCSWRMVAELVLGAPHQEHGRTLTLWACAHLGDDWDEWERRCEAAADAVVSAEIVRQSEGW